MEKFEVLTEDELAAIVGGVDAHRAVRERTGMCGCGVLPDTLHSH
jgi:bacteriocin-like protein